MAKSVEEQLRRDMFSFGGSLSERARKGPRAGAINPREGEGEGVREKGGVPQVDRLTPVVEEFSRSVARQKRKVRQVRQMKDRVQTFDMLVRKGLGY